MAPIALALVAGSVGCYRSTGESRPTTVAQQIPATGGDRVAGMKATAGPGDYYLGNDYIQMAVDGAAYGHAKGQFGAPSGGAILDIGGVALDTAYKRVSLPTDNLESLAPVVNQDPDLRLVFDRYSTTNTNDLVTLTMQGYLLDPLNKLAGATWASDGRVQGVTVTETITLGSHDTYFTLNTTLTNNSGAPLPIQSLGDYLHQRGGGYRFVIPANQDAAGNPLSTWGLDIPGSNFASPLTTSVRAAMVGLQGAEPSAQDLDSHQSLGILPMDQDQVLVASDPQTTLSEDRPIFPARLVVGSVPAGGSLASGAKLDYARRVYALAGSSLEPSFPSEAESAFNSMEFARASLRGLQSGSFTFTMAGTAAAKGYRKTEVRFERYTGDTTSNNPATDTNSSHWALERLVSPGGGESVPGGAMQRAVLVPAIPDPALSGSFLPYRVVIRNMDMETTLQVLPLQSSKGVISPATLLRPEPASLLRIATPFAAEDNAYSSANGNALSPIVFTQPLTLRKYGNTSGTGIYLPARAIILGLDSSGNPDPSKDPNVQRVRYLGGVYSPLTKSKVLTGRFTGAYQTIQGNEIFGTQFLPQSGMALFPVPAGSYAAIFTTGPLSPLASLNFSLDSTTPSSLKSLVLNTLPLPSDWATFDIPGPSQRTTGGMQPVEQLASALANGVQVVGRTDMDTFTDGAGLRSNFRMEFKSSGDSAVDDIRDQWIGGDPFIVDARSSELADGTFTSLFTPKPDSATPNGGALPSTGWTPADFIGQGGGSYVIANRPRGPQGLFTAHPVAPGVALGTGANSWWDDTDALANGRRTGDFDAIELLRGEGCNPADPSAWFAEFKNVRSDWFNLLNLETPTRFTKALGLSSGIYSLDTPVGLARTYFKPGSSLTQSDLSNVETALQSGAAVASTGPLLDVSVAGQGPGTLVTGTNASVTLTANLWFATWIPVDEIRVVVNGTVVQTLPLSSFTQDPADARHWSATLSVPMSANTGGKDGWIVVEAGVPLSTSGAYAAGTPWNRIMKGIYPIAVTNPIFVDVNGGGYTAPLP
ncbi:MAG: hypothetical protein JST24_05660 [Acidobacteria bacterium]|nr:hypothetical protein [Acidobacteriota bacterium]